VPPCGWLRRPSQLNAVFAGPDASRRWALRCRTRGQRNDRPCCLGVQAKSRPRARAQTQAGMQAIVGYGSQVRITGHGPWATAAWSRRAASCVLGQHTECYGSDDGEACRESDTFTKLKRPANNRMKLTSRAFQ
jgi:hypothetical protein